METFVILQAYFAFRVDSLQALSKIYAGTGALNSSVTRYGKRSLAGAIADARKSAARIYINNFADKERQNTIDMLLVSHLPIADQFMRD